MFTFCFSAYNGYYLQSQKIRRLIQNDFDNVFIASNPTTINPTTKPTSNTQSESDSTIETGSVTHEKVHYILTPAAVGTAPRVSNVRDGEALNKTDEYLNDVMTVPASLAGLAAIVVPVDITEDVVLKMGSDVVIRQDRREESQKLGVGVQLLGQVGDDDGVLFVASFL